MNTETKRHADRPAYNRKSKYREDPLEFVESEFDTGEPEDESIGLDDDVDEEAGNDEDQDNGAPVRRKQGGRG